jgi:hypothetical protein
LQKSKRAFCAIYQAVNEFDAMKRFSQIESRFFPEILALANREAIKDRETRTSGKPGRHYESVDRRFQTVNDNQNERKVMSTRLASIRFAHELDAAWIIALWKAIHGGDPAPEQIMVEAIAALSGTLVGHTAAGPAESSFEKLQARLKEIGVDFQAQAGERAAVSAESFVGRTYCVIFKGQRICFTLPKPFVWPPPGH